MQSRKKPTRQDASDPSAKKQAATVNGTRSHPGAGKSCKDGIEAAADTATMTTRVARKQKRGAISQLTDQVSKKQRLSTELRPLKANAELRARLRAEEEEATRPIVWANQEQSPFLRLPAELRIRIYKYALGGNIVVPRCAGKTDVTPGRITRYTADETAMKTFRGVVLTCRAFRAETELLLYSTNIFCCCDGSEWYTWIQLLDAKKRDAIHTVLIDGRNDLAMEWFAAKVGSSKVELPLGTLVMRGSRMERWWQALQASKAIFPSWYTFEEESDRKVTWFKVSWK